MPTVSTWYYQDRDERLIEWTFQMAATVMQSDKLKILIE